MPVGYRNVVFCEQLFRLVFVQVHGAREFRSGSERRYFEAITLRSQSRGHRVSQSSPAAVAGDVPELLLSTVEDPLPWRLLHILNLFHMVVGGLVVALYFSGGRPPLLGDTNPSLFLWTGIVYFSYSALASFSVRARRPAFSVQAYKIGRASCRERV